jgi:hypothetical protein
MSFTHKKCRPQRVGILKSCCRSLRWHYPDQVQRVGDDLGHPLSWTRPSSPRRLATFNQPKYRTASLGSQLPISVQLGAHHQTGRIRKRREWTGLLETSFGQVHVRIDGFGMSVDRLKNLKVEVGR